MESLKKKRERTKIIFETLDPLYTYDKTALKYRSPFQLLIAAILSAQCTDKQVNQVTKTLFKKYKGPEDFLKAPIAELEGDIRPTGFFRNKTKTIKGCCQGLVDFHGGKVPSTMEEMVKLPGVGRKTANVVLGAAFGIPGKLKKTLKNSFQRKDGAAFQTSSSIMAGQYVRPENRTMPTARFSNGAPQTPFSFHS
jgi:endonuclease-3